MTLYIAKWLAIFYYNFFISNFVNITFYLVSVLQYHFLFSFYFLDFIYVSISVSVN